MADLPVKLSSLRAQLITALAADNAKSKSSQEVFELIPSEEPKRISQNLYVLKSGGKYVRGTNGGGYKLTDFSKKVAAGIRSGEIEISRKLTGKAAKAAKNDLSFIPRKEVQEEIPFESLNISNSAATLADSLSAVIEENKQYRDLLLKLNQTIVKALGLDKKE